MISLTSITHTSCRPNLPSRKRSPRPIVAAGFLPFRFSSAQSRDRINGNGTEIFTRTDRNCPDRSSHGAMFRSSCKRSGRARPTCEDRLIKSRSSLGIDASREYLLRCEFNRDHQISCSKLAANRSVERIQSVQSSSKRLPRWPIRRRRSQRQSSAMESARCAETKISRCRIPKRGQALI